MLFIYIFRYSPISSVIYWPLFFDCFSFLSFFLSSYVVYVLCCYSYYNIPVVHYILYSRWMTVKKKKESPYQLSWPVGIINLGSENWRDCGYTMGKRNEPRTSRNPSIHK